MLEARLFIVEEGADAWLLLVVDDLLFEYLEFELHEVNLLLEIWNVLIFYTLVGICSQEVLRLSILPVELHGDCRIVRCAQGVLQGVETGAGSSETYARRLSWCYKYEMLEYGMPIPPKDYVPFILLFRNRLYI